MNLSNCLLIASLLSSSVHPKIFTGNNDPDKEAINVFEPPLFARYIRIHPRGWINDIALRLEVLGCDTQQGVWDHRTNATSSTKQRLRSRKALVKLYINCIKLFFLWLQSVNNYCSEEIRAENSTVLRITTSAHGCNNYRENLLNVIVCKYFWLRWMYTVWLFYIIGKVCIFVL